MKYFSFLFVFTFLYNLISFSQGEIDESKKILFRNEKGFAISANSNGFGFGYLYAKRININRKIIYEGDINTIKHQKEKKSTFYYGESLKRYVYGKTNSAFNIRAGIGQQHVLYKKFDRNSVGVRYFYTGGITAMFLKPIYYLVYEANMENYEWTLFEKNTPFWYIIDRKPFLNALNEIKVVPGIYARTGFNFDFGKEDKVLNVLEFGITLEAYPKEIKIMVTERNPSFIPTVYISYRWGKVVSGYYLKEEDERTE
jgi:hypothetical protein